MLIFDIFIVGNSLRTNLKCEVREGKMPIIYFNGFIVVFFTTGLCGLRHTTY